MPLIDSNCKYQVLHDSRKSLCFVGNTHYNKLLHNYFSTQRGCTLLTLEELEQQSSQWIQQHQFMSIASHCDFKYRAKTLLAQFNVTYFSVMAETAVIGHNVNIGYNTLIDQYSIIWDNVGIGDHCSVASYVNVAHGTVLDECCQVGPQCILNFTHCNPGVYIGARTNSFGHAHAAIDIVSYTNVTSDSRVLNSITEPGTYHSNRKINESNSLELAL